MRLPYSVSTLALICGISQQRLSAYFASYEPQGHSEGLCMPSRSQLVGKSGLCITGDLYLNSTTSIINKIIKTKMAMI